MLTEAKLRRICVPVDTGKLLLNQLPKTCPWANLLRTSIRHLETPYQIMKLEFCPGAIFTGPEGNGRHTHANALANNLVEKSGYQAVIGIHGSDLDFEDPDDVYDVLDFLEKIARSSGKTVLLLEQPELSDLGLRFQNHLVRLQQSLLAADKTIFLIIIARAAGDVAAAALSRFPRYHCPRPNTSAITAFVDNMLKNPVPIQMEKVTKPEIINALKGCSWKQLNDLHTQLLRMVVIEYQLHIRKYREKNLTEEQVYKEGHIKLSAKAVNAVLACVMDQNAASAVAAMPVAAGVPYVAGTAAAPAVTLNNTAAVSDKVPVVSTDEEVDPNDPIAQMIMGSDDPISSFLSYIGPVPEEEETN